MHAAKTKVTVTNGYFLENEKMLSTAPSPIPIAPVMAPTPGDRRAGLEGWVQKNFEEGKRFFVTSMLLPRVHVIRKETPRAPTWAAHRIRRNVSSKKAEQQKVREFFRVANLHLTMSAWTKIRRQRCSVKRA